MNWYDFRLSSCEVECDGSACGSGGVGWHVHPTQYPGVQPIGRIRVAQGATGPVLDDDIHALCEAYKAANPAGFAVTG